MKDPYIVLSQKEQDMERIRQEIRALLMVIPLLVDNETDSVRLAGKPSDDDMAALETYYPWVRHMRESQRK